MNHLPYLQRANEAMRSGSEAFAETKRIHLITNFTDDFLKKMIVGLFAENGIYADIYATPYKQYHFALKQPSDPLYQKHADATWIFFDANPYSNNEFIEDPDHFQQVFADIERLCSTIDGHVVLSTFLLPPHSVYGNLWKEDPLVALVEQWNRRLEDLAKQFPCVHLLDMNRIAHILGAGATRDMRHLYAFDLPFTQTFLFEAALEFQTWMNAISGKAKKCIVVDLDNTLWGGILGEAGVDGIALGGPYPGNIFEQVQRILLQFYERGIILAINSRNNIEDVREALNNHPNMILREPHFAAMAVNWNNKADNLEAIAKELNIGLDSLVFLDDDAMNRDLVRSRLPEVCVPELGGPETYVHTLLSLRDFPFVALTDEDRERGKMYAQERQRKDIQATTSDLTEYIRELHIEMDIRLNDASLIPRLAQLSQKTNQYNATTRRYTEQDLAERMAGGSLLYSADVKDRFGGYGVTLFAMVDLDGKAAKIDTFLMSCRVMGRNVEYDFLNHILVSLKERGVQTVTAEYISTAKNKPIEPFFSSAGFIQTDQTDDGHRLYAMRMEDYPATGLVNS
ncbi:MAG: HAD-IIIC family phosphatase [Patescibacteria group bacterium]